MVIPPSRPSPEQLEHIRLRLNRVDRAMPVAVLGATPEFRDLLGQLEFASVFVFDRNADFFRQMTAARALDTKEHFIEGDWLETLGSFSDQFSVILSDLTSGNLEYRIRAQFYALVEAALRPDSGMFFDKVLTNEKPLLSLQQIAEFYSWQPINLQTLNYFSCDSLFSSELILEHELVDTTTFYDRLEAEFTTARLRKFVHFAELITPRGGIWYYGRPWGELSSVYCPRLETADARSMPDDGPYAGRVRHFVMLRNNA